MPLQVSWRGEGGSHTLDVPVSMATRILDIDTANDCVSNVSLISDASRKTKVETKWPDDAQAYRFLQAAKRAQSNYPAPNDHIAAGTTGSSSSSAPDHLVSMRKRPSQKS